MKTLQASRISSDPRSAGGREISDAMPTCTKTSEDLFDLYERFGDLALTDVHCGQIAAPCLVAGVDGEKLFGADQELIEVDHINLCGLIGACGDDMFAVGREGCRKNSS